MPRPSEEERVLAALAHAAIILNAFNLLGLVAAVVVLMAQRRRSAYVVRHTLQAIAFQTAGLLITLVLLVGWVGCLFFSLIPAMLRPELYRDAPPLAFWLALATGLLIGLFAAAGMVYGLVGAWAAWHGRPFRYMLIGPLVEQRLYALAEPSPPAPAPVPRPRDTGPLDE